MSSDNLLRLEWARQEVERRTRELDEKRRRQEIGGVEHKILLHERLFGREEQELLSHIDSQISDARSAMRERNEIRIGVLLIGLAMVIAFASTFFVTDIATGNAVSTGAAPGCWNETTSGSSHTAPDCNAAENLKEK